MSRGDLAYRVEIEGIAQRVSENDRLGPRTDGVLDLLCIDIIGRDVNIDEYGDHSV